ncbi:MAG: MerR family transcriptional regulator [Rhodobacteraceae bacterium]|nr:MerR family transcriptional regulator [Paracoccaceae bacterium]
MAKSREAFRTISEVSDWLETPAHVLRFWESRFPQVKPLKRAGGRRYYRPNDMQLLGGIKRLLHDDGITIKGVQKILREKGVKHVSGLCLETLDAGATAKPSSPASPVDVARESVPADPHSDKSPLASGIAPTVFQPTRTPEPAAPTLPEENRLVFTAPRAATVSQNRNKAATTGKPPLADRELDRMIALYSRLERLRDRVAADLG